MSSPDELPDELSPDDNHHDGPLSGEGQSRVPTPSLRIYVTLKQPGETAQKRLSLWGTENINSLTACRLGSLELRRKPQN